MTELQFETLRSKVYSLVSRFNRQRNYRNLISQEISNIWVEINAQEERIKKLEDKCL